MSTISVSLRGPSAGSEGLRYLDLTLAAYVGEADLQAARTARRRALRTQLRARRSLADEILPAIDARLPPRAAEPSEEHRAASRLRRYRED